MINSSARSLCLVLLPRSTLELKTRIPLVRGLHGRVFLYLNSSLLCECLVTASYSRFTVVFPEYTMVTVTLPCYFLAVPIQESASWGGAKPCQGTQSE